MAPPWLARLPRTTLAIAAAAVLLGLGALIWSGALDGQPPSSFTSGACTSIVAGHAAVSDLDRALAAYEARNWGALRAAAYSAAARAQDMLGAISGMPQWSQGSAMRRLLLDAQYFAATIPSYFTSSDGGAGGQPEVSAQTVQNLRAMLNQARDDLSSVRQETQRLGLGCDQAPSTDTGVP